MTLLQTISPATAQGETAQIYAQMKEAFGGVPNAMQIWSSSPFLLKQAWASVSYAMNHPTLSGPLLACVRMLVSQGNRCDYCIDMNAGMLVNRFGWTQEQVAATRADPAAADLPEREKAMLLLVLKAVRDAFSVSAADLDALRGLGWSDGEILEAVSFGARMVAGDIVFNAFRIERDF